MDERQLVRDCLKWKPAAQQQLYEHFAKNMLAVCYRYTKSFKDAEDVLQEGFVKVFFGLKQFRFEGDLGAWIRRIMVNTALNFLKRNSKYRDEMFFTEQVLHPVADDDPAVILQAKELADLIRQLPHGYQTIFNLHAVEGYSHVEIGEMLGISDSTSRSQYARARSLLISWIEEYSIEQKNKVMPVNEFEKQVQQKMDELQLRPSAEVWEEVEKRIRKEKKRRGVILWFFILAMLLLGGTGWLFISGNKKQSLTNNAEKIITTGNKKINDTNTTSDTSIKQREIEIKIPIDEKTTEDEKIQTAINSVTSKKENVIKISKADLLLTEKFSKKKNKITSSEREIASEQNQIKEVIGKTEAINNEEPLKITEANVTADKEVIEKNSIINSMTPDSVAATVSKSKINNIDSLNQEVAIKKEDSLSIKTEEKIATNDTNKKKKSKLEIWLVSTGGISNNANGLGVNSQKSLDAYQNMSPAASFVAAPVLTPTAPTTGFMWQTGIYSKLILNKKVSFSAGLNFSSYSTRQTTGIFVNTTSNYVTGASSSSARGYYLSGTSGAVHINHYYYLELPVSFHWQLNKGKKLPLIWQNGFATGFFLGGNALVYNSGTNIFYKDNKSFNKIQFSYQSGLYAKLFNKSSKPITVGALFNYQLGKLQKANSVGGNHLSSFGIQMGWLLKK